jgi:prepilin-type N-terminal cleavage/methylation domain-containing protein
MKTEREKNTQGGFTLIELLVSVAIFSVVMLIAVGSLLTMTEASRKAQALKSVMNNLNFALESMSRTIRVGTNYHCGIGGAASTQDCIQGSSYFAFEGSGGDPNDPSDQVVYRLIDSQIERSTDGGDNFLAITASEVVIEDLQFYVVGSAPGPDTIQPKVVMTIQGYADITPRTRTEFNLQTTIAQRLPDI